MYDFLKYIFYYILRLNLYKLMST